MSKPKPPEKIRVRSTTTNGIPYFERGAWHTLTGDVVLVINEGSARSFWARRIAEGSVQIVADKTPASPAKESSEAQ
jgi:hypothetical protein